MSLKLSIPAMQDANSGDTIVNAIATVDPTAQVEVDVDAQTVTVQSPDGSTPVASEESIKQAIIAAGYSIQY